MRLVFCALFQQFGVELFQRTNTRQRNTDIAANVANQVFDQPLLITGRWITKHRLEAVVCCKLCIVLLCNGMSAKSALDGDTGIVKDDLPGYTAKELDCPG